MKIKSIKQAKDLKNKTFLVRCDFDVPLEQKNKKTKKQKNTEIVIADDVRLKACLPIIEFLLKKKAKIILMGHLGRPKGSVVPDLSLEPVRDHLEKILNKNINFIKNFTLTAARHEMEEMRGGEIACLENLRFWISENKNDKKFANSLANLADIYVNEAFATSHRNVASIDVIQDFLPSFAGLNLEKEIENLSKVTEKPSRPLVVIIGGAKIETKLPVIDRFLAKADYLLIGGAIANNFFKVLGYEVGKSIVDEDYLDEAGRLLQKSEGGFLGNKFQIPNNKFQINSKFQIPNSKFELKDIKKLKHKIILPIDVKIKGARSIETKKLEQVKKTDKILDIGSKTLNFYGRMIKGARTIVWNGPMGYFEEKEFSCGTFGVADHILKSRAKSLIGGGETAEALSQLVKNKKLPNRIFVSTGGGAMLEFLAGKKLPGLKKIL